MKAEKKFEKEERLKLEKKKKRLINQFIIFLLHIIFFLNIDLSKNIFVFMLNFYYNIS